MKLYQIDAFTGKPFQGNPAGVCLVDDITQDVLFQNLALEMNLSETAFLLKTAAHEYRLRWFTPTAEIEFCGHATLASAHLLWEQKIEDTAHPIVFHTLAGPLIAKPLDDRRIELDFPRRTVRETEPSPLILNGFGTKPLFTGTDGKRYLIEVEDAATLLEMTPDFALLKTAGKTAFTLTCHSDRPQYDYLTRFFAPALGIDEDPVTGSAISYLAPYWVGKFGKQTLVGYQASKRGGVIECCLSGTDRVLLRGQAVTVFEIDARL